MEYDNYDDLLAVEDYDAYDNVDDDYADFDEELEDGLDELYEALMEADDEALDEDIENLDERRRPKRGRRAIRRVSFRPPRPAKSKGGCCINPQVSRDLMALKRKDAIQDRKLQVVDSRSRTNASVNKVQTRGIGKLNKQMKLDGALDFASSIGVTSNGLEINLAQVFKGLIKTGMLGDSKGALGNPVVIGGLGVLLNNPSILSGLFAPRP